METNNVSLLNIFEQLDVTLDNKIKDAPLGSGDLEVQIPIDYEVVSLWHRDSTNKEEECTIKIVLKNPDGNEKLSLNQKIILPVGMKRFRSRFRINGFFVSMEGDYRFLISTQDNVTGKFIKVAEVPVYVNINITSNKDKQNATDK